MNKLASLTAANAASIALALSDGTAVEFVKVTGKDNIQVRLPDDHPYAEDQENGRIFRRDGSHYKGETELTLIATDAATVTAADLVAPAAAPISAVPAAANDTTYIVDGNSFSSLDDAKAEAIDLFRDTGQDVEILATVVVGRVGFTALAA